jgi:hypothetical protein
LTYSVHAASTVLACATSVVASDSSSTKSMLPLFD